MAKTSLPRFMNKESQSTIDFSTSSPATPSSSANAKSSQSLTDKLKAMLGLSTKTVSTLPLSIEDELVLFNQAIQSFRRDFSSFWIEYRDKFSRLYRVALRVNIIPATSVASESVFSVAGYVARKQRASLSSTSLRELMVLKESHRLDSLRSISHDSVN